MGEWTSVLRLGSTSYVYPDDVLPNVRRLSGLVRDVEWVVFEASYGLPGREIVAEMARLARVYGHSYTVHLPLDLGLACTDAGRRRESTEAARRVIAAARALQPWAYVVHLEREGSGEAWGPWHERAAESLAVLGHEAGAMELLALENLPGYPPEHLWPLLERLPVSLCLDLGHLAHQGRDPRPILDGHLGRTRAIHLHGVEGGRGHRSLAAMDQSLLLALLRTLWVERFSGVVTIELFAAEPFFESWKLVENLWRRLQRSACGDQPPAPGAPTL